MRIAAALLLASLMLGCDPPGPSTVPTAPVPTSSSGPDTGIVDPGVFPSKRFGMKLKLPRSSTWKIDDTRTRWLVATQPAEGSSLLVRLWRDENRMNRDKCEERARSFRKLPGRDGAEILSEQALDLPAGFDTRADVGIVADPKGGGLFGFVLAFGGLGRQCFAYVYVTRVEGPKSDERVAERLAEMMEGSLSKLKFDSDLEAVLERDAATPDP